MHRSTTLLATIPLVLALAALTTLTALAQTPSARADGTASNGSDADSSSDSSSVRPAEAEASEGGAAASAAPGTAASSSIGVSATGVVASGVVASGGVASGGDASGAESMAVPDPGERVELLLQRSFAHLQASRIDSAASDLLLLLRFAPADRRVHRALVHLHDAQGRLWESFRIFETLSQRYPRQAALLVTLGEIELLRGHPERAVIQFEKAVVIDQEHQAAMAGLARSRFALGKVTETFEYFEKLLLNHQRSVACRMGKAILLAGQEEYKAAATQFKWAVTLDPQSWMAERDYARMLVTVENLELAIKHYRRGIEILEGMNDQSTAGALREELGEVMLRPAQDPQPEPQPQPEPKL